MAYWSIADVSDLIWWILIAIVGLATFAGLTVAILLLVPRATIPRVIGLLVRLFYRVRVYGLENVPPAGGAVLVANHLSWIDGILMVLLVPRHVRMMVYAGNFRSRTMQRLGRLWGAIQIAPGPKAIVKALKTAQQAVAQGDLVGIFPEGGISRSGMLQTFHSGILKVLEGTDAPVIPIYFDGLWGSIFSFERGRFFWKIPKKIPYPVSVYIGKPVAGIRTAQEVRQAVEQLGAYAVDQRKSHRLTLPTAVIKSCKRRKFRAKVADSTGAVLTGGSLLMRTLILRRLLRRYVLAEDERHVGLMIPPSNGAVITNLALGLDRRVAINLNYTVSEDVVNQCIQQAEIKHVLTSRKVMEKLEMKLDAELVYLEDYREKVTLADKLTAALQTYLLPGGWLARQLGVTRIDPDELLTLIFTSGSTGIPKGVMLTHNNIGSNVEAVDRVIQLSERDVILGILPFFHSFGYTVTFWAVAALNVGGAYHFNPLDARQVGKLCARNKGTILLATPTFLRSYIRRCTPEDFQTLDTVVTGAERLPKDVGDAFAERFGVQPVEGYGTTELSPLVSVNIPPSRTPNSPQTDRKEGTVGRCVPGVTAKIVNLDTQEDQPVNAPGMLMISGPNVMKGYWKQPDKTAEVLRDGWYSTGDVALIDDEGFIRITGRESRFSKIGGEMVPHVRIEEVLNEVVGQTDDDEDQDGPQLVVTAIPDRRKGERLIILHTRLAQTPSELCAALKERGLPNLFIPSADSFMQVDSLPLLGTGKLDLRTIRQMALERYGESNGENEDD